MCQLDKRPYVFNICLYLHGNYNKIPHYYIQYVVFALANSSSTFKFYLNKSGETRRTTDVKQHGSGGLQLAPLYTPPRWKKTVNVGCRTLHMAKERMKREFGY